jgi:hypothetical protein
VDAIASCSMKESTDRRLRSSLSCTRESVAIARIDALAGLGAAVSLTLLASLLVIGVTVVLGTLTFAFVRIVVSIVAGFGLTGMILGHIKRNAEQGN